MARVQVRITLPGGFQKALEPVRATWNPERATGNPAHVTIIYDDEASDRVLLAKRLRAAAAGLESFTLVLGLPARFPAPARGVFLSVSDPTDRIATLRKRVLAPPFTPRRRFGLHVTLLHPDQGDRLESAWPELSACPALGSFQVTELQVIGPANETLATVKLVPAPP